MKRQCPKGGTTKKEKLVAKEGLTPHEALDVVDMLKNNCFYAMCEIKRESDNK